MLCYSECLYTPYTCINLHKKNGDSCSLVTYIDVNI